MAAESRSNPQRSLADLSAFEWDHLVAGVNPAALLVTIESRLGAALKRRTSAEDVFQEALLHAWRDRAGFEWRGPSSFRRWLLTIIDHRIHHLAEAAGTQKRRGELRLVDVAGVISRSSFGGTFAGPMTTTRPSKIAEMREQADAMRLALESLPDDLRDVVRLRVFDSMTAEDVAGILGIGVSAVHHRTRRGVELYRSRLTKPT